MLKLRLHATRPSFYREARGGGQTGVGFNQHDVDVRRSVVLFRCDWYNQVGKTRGVRDDGHFKSINIESFWYKSDSFILATQSKKIFYLPDIALGKDWRIVQKFEHRAMYNVSEKDDHCAFVHQDDSCSDTEHDVQ